MMINYDLLPNMVRDEPGKYDILWGEHAEGDTESKKVLDQVKLKVWNQYDQKESYCGCSAYGLTYIYNGYQSIEWAKNGMEFEQENPRWKWDAFQATRGYPQNKGASLQQLMSFFKQRGLIDGYLKTTSVEETKNAIKNGCLIYTGSSKCSWSKTSKEKEFVYDENGASHCFAIVDYDDTGFIAINSFGENRGNKGYFHIDYDKYQYLFTTYAIIDHDDTGKLSELVFNAQYQKAIELGITNGTRPNDPVTRKECSVICYRVYKMLKQ